MQKAIPAGILLLSCFLSSPQSSRGAVFNVSNEAELQQALLDSSASAEDDTINIAAGPYLTSNNGGAPFTYLVNSMDPPAGGLTLIGQGVDQTFLDGNNAAQVMDIQDYASTGTLLVENLSIQNGNSNTNVGGLGINL